MPEQLPSANPQAMTPLVFVLTVVCCLVSLGCRNDEIGESRQPSLAAATLTAIDSVLLEEAGGAFIAKPADLVVGHGGTLLIPDVGMKRLFEFAADGRSVRSFGHAGSGPGEFVSPGWSTLVADSTILVKDNPALELEAFSLTRGQWMWSRRLPSSVTSGIAYAGDDILVAELNAQSRTSFLRTGYRCSWRVASGRARRRGACQRVSAVCAGSSGIPRGPSVRGLKLDSHL